jgi:biotin carboxyl carrier protein
MEYKIQAPFDGMVKQVNCNIGETVQLGQILAIIEPSQE